MVGRPAADDGVERKDQSGGNKGKKKGKKRWQIKVRGVFICQANFTQNVWKNEEQSPSVSWRWIDSVP